jgi:hypothetical protein
MLYMEVSSEDDKQCSKSVGVALCIVALCGMLCFVSRD